MSLSQAEILRYFEIKPTVSTSPPSTTLVYPNVLHRERELCFRAPSAHPLLHLLHLHRHKYLIKLTKWQTTVHPPKTSLIPQFEENIQGRGHHLIVTLFKRPVGSMRPGHFSQPISGARTLLTWAQLRKSPNWDYGTDTVGFSPLNVLIFHLQRCWASVMAISQCHVNITAIPWVLLLRSCTLNCGGCVNVLHWLRLKYGNSVTACSIMRQCMHHSALPGGSSKLLRNHGFIADRTFWESPVRLSLPVAVCGEMDLESFSSSSQPTSRIVQNHAPAICYWVSTIQKREHKYGERVGCSIFLGIASIFIGVWHFRGWLERYRRLYRSVFLLPPPFASFPTLITK